MRPVSALTLVLVLALSEPAHARNDDTHRARVEQSMAEARARIAQEHADMAARRRERDEQADEDTLGRDQGLEEKRAAFDRSFAESRTRDDELREERRLQRQATAEADAARREEEKRDRYRASMLWGKRGGLIAAVLGALFAQAVASRRHRGQSASCAE